MPDAKWTPGPWVAAEGAEGYVHPDTGGLGMMSIEGGAAGSDGWGEHERLTLAVVIADVEPIASEAEANARLIAAAPDLAEALRNVLESIGGMADDLGLVHASFSSDEVEAIEAALTKAEGGSDER